MQLFTRVLLLAVTVLGASAWPRMGEDTSLLRMVMAQLGSPLVEGRAFSPAESACVNKYNNATNKVSENLTNATSKCEEAANRTLISNSQSSNASVTDIRNQQLTLQKNLQLCLNETDSQRLINCTTSTFDKNLQLLDSSNTLAYQTQSQFASNATVVETQRSSCISAAVGESKVQSIEAANDFNTCMANVPKQRELPATPVQEEHKEQPKQQQQQQQPEQKPEQQSAQVALPAQGQTQAQPQAQAQSQAQVETAQAPQSAN